MTLSSPKPWLQQAQRDRFAIGAFKANTLEQVQAIVMAAEEAQTPVIVQISHHALQYIGSGSEILGLRYIAGIGRVAAESVNVPVALHLDHGTENEVLQAMAVGFTSVMFDGGDLPFEQNVETTIRLCEMARSVGICFEGEVGAVPRAGLTGKVDHENTLTQPEDAAEFARLTQIDSLAIAIGSVHAIRDKHVRLNLARLRAIEAVVNLPLFLHGSSGVTDENILASIMGGICKVNTATQLTQAFTGAVRTQLASDTTEVDPRKYLGPARLAMKERVHERIHFLGITGKAVLPLAGVQP